eukprot:9777762-Heterocapsa_arctica.AAC.1
MDPLKPRNGRGRGRANDDQLRGCLQTRIVFRRHRHHRLATATLATVTTHGCDNADGTDCP